MAKGSVDVKIGNKLSDVLNGLAAIAILTFVAFSWDWLRHREARQKFTAPLDFVNVDGQEIHIHRTAAGGPATVVFEAGLFDVASDWLHLQRLLAPTVSTFAYDRPGTGFSDALPGGQDGRTIARNLHLILAAAGARPPYVLVAHSIGSFYAELFADAYPNEVAGLVLLEPMHVDEYERQPATATAADQRFLAHLNLMKWPARLSFARMTGPYRGFAEGLPKNVVEEVDELNRSGGHLAGVAAEADALEETKNQARKISGFGALPLAIFSAAQPHDEATKATQAMHREMLGLSSKSELHVAATATHASIVHDAHESAAIFPIIQKFVAGAKRGH